MPDISQQEMAVITVVSFAVLRGVRVYDIDVAWINYLLTSSDLNSLLPKLQIAKGPRRREVLLQLIRSN